jgi:hypothetical protein
MLVYLPGSWEGPRAKQLTLAEQAARRANDEARRLVASGGRR